MADEAREKPRNWSRRQWRFLEWLAADKYSRAPATQQLLAKQLGLNHGTLSRWKKLPGFLEEVNRLARESVRHSLPQTYAALVREADKGSYQHIKLLLEIAGEIPLENGDQTINLIIRRAHDTTVPAHLAPSAINGHLAAPTVQHRGVREALGQDHNGHGSGD